MTDNMVIVQLRSTIFLQQNIGYTPENAAQFQILLLPNSKVYGIPQPGVPMLGINPTIPQYGLPWRIFEKCEDGSEYNIAFQPGKIDIILAKEADYNTNIEVKFCQQSIMWFNKILDALEGHLVTRIAYAPLYAINKDGRYSGDAFWDSILKKTVFDGTQMQDVNLQFLLKQLIKFGDREIHMNLLYNLFDGKQSKTVDNNLVIKDVLLMQLDLNSIPEIILNIDKKGVADFFNAILEIKDKLIENVG